jgi:CubicO group peptidase (beta-lactamase class C family)
MLAAGGTLDGHRILSEESVDAMFTPHAKIAGLGPENSQFGYGFALGDEQSEKAGMQPARTASWSGSGNTYFFVDRRHKAVAVLMTHMLASGEYAARTLALRRMLNTAAERLIEK